MKKHLFLLVRLLIAAAGVGYIVWALTWTDHVQVPARTTQSAGRVVATTLPNGETLTEARSFAVVEGDATAFDAGEAVTIAIEGEPLAVPAEPRGTGEKDYQFKPGVITTLRTANVGLLLLGLLVVAPTFPILSLRWMLLLRARGLSVSFGRSFCLVMVSSFFNYCMPGLTGGDVVKAYYAAKGSNRKMDAIMSIIVDRVVGLSGLILVGGVAGLFMLRHPASRQVTTIIWLLALALAAGSFVYFSRGLRRIFRIDRLLEKLPGSQLFARIDEATVAYRDHKSTLAVAMVMAIFVHGSIIACMVFAGMALGIGQPVGLMVTVIPLLVLVGAIPITYQGLGIMEGVAVPLLVKAPLCSANQLIGMLMLYRIYVVAYSLLGSLYLLRRNIQLHPQEGEEGGKEIG